MTVAWMFPGQGSQHRGMGADLFDNYPELVARCDRAVGLDMRTLCLTDPDGRLSDTRYAQPALFLVNALWARRALARGERADLLLGHSLGEYNALEVAGALDFGDAVDLIAERGRLMGAARGGGMAAVVGAKDLGALLADADAGELELANLNLPSQVVVSGNKAAIGRLVAHARATKAARVVPLAVSAAFHSRHMDEAAAQFEGALDAVHFRDPSVPVIANVTGRPYPPGKVRELLSRQMRCQVRWWDSLQLLRRQGVTDARQLGPGDVLVKLWQAALKEPLAEQPEEPLYEAETGAGQPPAGIAAAPARRRPAQPATDQISRRGRAFCAAHGVREPYVAGAMYRGIASVELVLRMARAGLLGVLGTGGLDSARVEGDLRRLAAELPPNSPWGVNLLATPDHPELEQQLVDLYQRHEVPLIEAAAYTQISAPLVEYRFRGAELVNGRAIAPHRVIAKVSRREVAEQFMQPPPERLLAQLQAAGRLDARAVAAARRLPVASAVCAEADSGGHTDGGVALALLPTMVRLRDRLASLGLDEPVQVGAAGGLGSPEAVAAAFVLGAEFIVTGSINQCTPEAATSEAVKDLLAQLEVGDTTYAPAGDMFELGARVQVVRKGTLFPPRANFLYQVYRAHGSMEEIDGSTQRTVERYLGCSLDDAWDRARARLQSRNPQELARANSEPRVRMARTFKVYFAHSVEAAMRGDLSQRANFQVHSGPAIGALNADLRETALRDWQSRHVDELAEHLLTGARKVLSAHI